MPRPKPVAPGIRLHIILPEDLWGRMNLDLWSPAEQRIPFGARNKLVVQLLREHYNRKDSPDATP